MIGFERTQVFPVTLLLITSALALLASVWPLPVWAAWLRPEFAAMLVIYWVLSAPFAIGTQ